MNESNSELPVLDREWILSRRPARNEVSFERPYFHLHENELAKDGQLKPTNTIFLTNTECPFQCLMCDLWKNTLSEPTPPGAIPNQIRYALDRLPKAQQIKLYNSGIFFDKRAIPYEDHPTIADLCKMYETVIVESHPSYVGNICKEFSDRIPGQLEVAMGLETVHPEVLGRLNKKMTLDDFANACSFMTDRKIEVRAFILIRPPFMNDREGVDWAVRSAEWAYDHGVNCVALIPTRFGNGAMEELAKQGHFDPPSFDAIEEAFDRCLQLQGGRCFVDLWDMSKFVSSVRNAAERIDRMQMQNDTQILTPSI